jgi:hypothetical protein
LRAVVNDIPVGLLVILVVGGAVAIVLLGVWLVWRRPPGDPRGVRRPGLLADARRAVKGGLDALVGTLLLIGSVVILGYATLVGSRHFGFHAVGAGAIAVVVAFTLVVLLDLSYPFSGSFAIDPSPFESGVLERLSAP